VPRSAGHLPYVFGSGCCFITGTNVMVRTKAAYCCSRFYDADTGSLVPARNGAPPQLLSEEEISEDIELGSRIHAAGFKCVLVPENLATGEARFCSFYSRLLARSCRALPVCSVAVSVTWAARGKKEACVRQLYWRCLQRGRKRIRCTH
jgi:hypothetical protein